MGKAQNVAVIDIGKSNAKVLLIDLKSAMELVVLKSSNQVVSGPPYPHFDTDRLYQFIVSSLGAIAKDHRIDAISITAHGSAAALVDANGRLALPVLDYEHNGPDLTRSDYEQVRPAFSETGSSSLPAGLNLGAQIFWLSRSFPYAFAKTRWILTLPQYWSFRLTGIAASEPTSLGCHTDLWDPWNSRFSSLVTSEAIPETAGWARLFPPVSPAGKVLGPLKPDIAAATGLSANLPVLSGIHDSNASLLPYLGRAKKPFSVMSTGTWIITLAVGGKKIELKPGRDTLVNVNARGEPTPTARFMGGREYEMITRGEISSPTERDIGAVLSGPVMAMPSQQKGTGPFPHSTFHWLDREPEREGERACAASFYCALMGSVCLDLIGAEGPVYVEGPFASNRQFTEMLAASTGRDVIPSGQSAGTGLGAAMLVGPATSAYVSGNTAHPTDGGSAMMEYARKWRIEAERL